MARKSVISAAILELLQRPDHHAWTLKDLHAGLGETAADFSSVFRAAEKLAAAGVLRKLTLDDGRAHFEPAGAHHDHLHCLDCGELIAVPCLIGRDACSTLEAEIGVTIAEHHVILSGRCAKCRVVDAGHAGTG
jgi:Fur family ferric uptake transcriptional regulator